MIGKGEGRLQIAEEQIVKCKLYFPSLALLAVGPRLTGLVARHLSFS